MVGMHSDRHLFHRCSKMSASTLLPLPQRGNHPEMGSMVLVENTHGLSNPAFAAIIITTVFSTTIINAWHISACRLNHRPQTLLNAGKQTNISASMIAVMTMILTAIPFIFRSDWGYSIQRGWIGSWGPRGDFGIHSVSGWSQLATVARSFSTWPSGNLNLIWLG